jgi:aspartyl-tRNA(Asn)/glutamyl-tRNA(Gln) amidotransferase subunit A
MRSGPTLESLADDLAAGRTSGRALTEACLAAIARPDGEGARAFVAVDADGALAQADAMDALRRAAVPPSRFAGIPVSIKDLFDVAGQVTASGAAALRGAAPAVTDAVAVARLRRAGFVLVGRTNMSEFAFSGLGLNPHHGTPLAAWDRAGRRAPGGSTSGGAVSVADGMAHATLGTDTGGSCRIPAAFNGLVGFKPTASRVPQEGTMPLSPTLDSIGPIARSVACCAALDAILADEPAADPALVPIEGLRLAVPRTLVLDRLDDAVAGAFARALSRLSAAGARIVEIEVPAFAAFASLAAKGSIPAAESYAFHRDLLEREGALFDPRVRARIERGAAMSAADYLDLLAARARLIAETERAVRDHDALVMPTAAIVPPLLSALETDEAFGAVNLLALRNTTMINLLDGCAISIPIQRPGEAPVGLSLAGPRGRDHAILRQAAAVEALLVA